MQMKARIITLPNGKKYRALKPGELICDTDIWLMAKGTAVPEKGFDAGKYQTNAEGIFQSYRPISKKAPAKKKQEPKIKAVKAWVHRDFFDPNMCPSEGFWRISEHKDRIGSPVPVLISPLNKKARSK